LKAFTTKLTHAVAGPLWLTNVRVFDATNGRVGAPTNVGGFRDTIIVPAGVILKTVPASEAPP
jgi:hypothetical protein